MPVWQQVIGRYLQKHDANGGCSYMSLFRQAHWVYNAIVALGCRKGSMEVVQAAPCRAGDVLIMHPFLVHSASLNYSKDMRFAFNLGVRWRRVPRKEIKASGISTTELVGDSGGAAEDESDTQSLLPSLAEKQLLLVTGDDSDEMLNMDVLLSEYRLDPEHLAPLPRALARAALGKD